MSQAVCFGLLRHAETVWNRQQRIQGRMDSPLTKHGIDSCRRWGKFLASPSWSWKRIICSPAGRARETARLINEALGIEIETADDLREQDWGAWEGLTMADITGRYREQVERLERSGWNFRPPSGESRSEVGSRASDALRTYEDLYPGQRILVISHQTVIKSLIYAVEKRRFLPEEPELIGKNRLHTIVLSDGRFAAGRYNIDPAEPA
jgi:broad specificity phosphatase PhoE